MTDRGTMSEVSHTPANAVGVDAWFRRESVAVTDGGRSSEDQSDEFEKRDATTERMADVSHSDEDHADTQVEIWSRGANDEAKVSRDVDRDEDHE